MTTATPSAAVSDLDKRRAKWLATVQAATEAEGALAVLDGEIEATGQKRDASKAELAAAIERSAELEKEIKALAKQRKRLRADRERAKRDAKRSRGRAKVAEKKFDRALLKDMLRKARSEALTASAPAAPRARTRTVAKAAPRRTTARRAATT
jgi:chromosome segregation ATPase